MLPLIITIDGPAGTGKSTVARMLAQRLGLPHLDTGAFYRAVTLAAIRSGFDIADPAQMERLAESVALEQVENRMLLDGEDVTAEIRSPEVGAAVSMASSHPAVRSVMVAQQRDWVARRGGRAVVEGRDIGSVVFPDAGLKVYLEASPEERARRRAAETGETYERVLSAQADRDRFDSSREVSPLTVPQGAIVVDTTRLSIDEVVERIATLADSSC